MMGNGTFNNDEEVVEVVRVWVAKDAWNRVVFDIFGFLDDSRAGTFHRVVWNDIYNYKSN